MGDEEADERTLTSIRSWCEHKPDDAAEEIIRLRKEIERLREGLESIVNCKNPLTRAAVREACAEILSAER